MSIEALTVETSEAPAPQATGRAGPLKSRLEFKSGNEAAVLAARDIGFDLMGHFPVAPAADVGERLLRARSAGQHDMPIVQCEGGNSAAGICYGAALGGGRAFGATSSQGLINALQQLSVQASARVPMVLNVATGSVSAPLAVASDYSGLYCALNTGCIVLCARDPQAVYDLNFAAVKIGEHREVRLPVIVAYDGFATGLHHCRIQAFDDSEAVRKFLGERASFPTPLDGAHPATFGTPMDEAGATHNRYQLSLAMDAAQRVIPEVLADLQSLTGRAYPMLDTYRMDDAEAAVVLINSAAETAKESADALRDAGSKVGVMSPNVLRPFPAGEFRGALRGVKSVTVGDRADSYGAGGGNLSLEVRAALQSDPGNATRVISRIYGLGGSAFHARDAAQFLELALDAANPAKTVVAFAYHGVDPGVAESVAPTGLPPLPPDAARGMAQVRRDDASGLLRVELEPLWKMTKAPHRIAPGHGACPGCGNFSTLHQIYNVLEGDVVTLFQTGCAMAVSSSETRTAHRINCVHNACDNAAATLSGLVEMYHERVRRGELPSSNEATFIMITGDAGLDAGIGSAIGAALRNHHMMILEFDSQMELGAGGVATGVSAHGCHCRDSTQIFAACHLPYVFTAAEGYPEDLMRKVAKAQWYAKNEGLVFGRILTCCPLDWGVAEDTTERVLQAAIDSCYFPLYEVEHGRTAITYDPDAMGRRRPLSEWLALMGGSGGLAVPENSAAAVAIEAETGRRWARLKAMHAHPLL